MFSLEFYLLASGVKARDEPSWRLSTFRFKWSDRYGDLKSGEVPPERHSSSFSMIGTLKRFVAFVFLRRYLFYKDLGEFRPEI